MPRLIISFRWQPKIINKEVLRRTGLTTMYTTLSQRRLGHVLRKSDERIPKDLHCIVSWPLANVTSVEYDYDTNVCKRDLKSLNEHID